MAFRALLCACDMALDDAQQIAALDDALTVEGHLDAQCELLIAELDAHAEALVAKLRAELEAGKAELRASVAAQQQAAANGQQPALTSYTAVCLEATSGPYRGA
jgi:hypothetical protein